MADQRLDTPEFHIVMRRPNGRGPLAAYRFAITVAIALALTGMPVWEAAQAGDAVDTALLRLGGLGVFVWFVLGKIDKILASAPPPRRPADDAVDS